MSDTFSYWAASPPAPQGTISQSYAQVGKLNQFKGVISGQIVYVKCDENLECTWSGPGAGYPLFIFDVTSNTWLDIRGGPVPIFTNSLTPSLSQEEAAQVSSGVLSSGFFKTKTQYLVIGDEPSGGSGIVDLSKMLSLDQQDKFKTFLTFMPRQFLFDWFKKNVVPSFPGALAVGSAKYMGLPAISSLYPNDFMDMVWAAFIDFFNSANLAYINSHQLSPWDWEQQKLTNFFISQNKDQLESLNKTFADYEKLNSDPDPKAKELMLRYSSLPPIGDPGLEISRQNAVKQLLLKKEYVVVEGIIDAFNYAQYTVLGESITRPIPFSIITDDGKQVLAT